eukprot:11065981-Alexandrium_andersonii.AAC.1
MDGVSVDLPATKLSAGGTASSQWALCGERWRRARVSRARLHMSQVTPSRFGRGRSPSPRAQTRRH